MRHLACSALTYFPLSCAGVQHWSRPEGRVSRGTSEQRAPPCMPRKAPLPSWPHCFSPSAPWEVPADQDTPCHLALGDTSCPSSLGGAHFRETDSKAPHFLLRVQTRPPAARAASGTRCVPGAPGPGSRTLPPCAQASLLLSPQTLLDSVHNSAVQPNTPGGRLCVRLSSLLRTGEPTSLAPAPHHSPNSEGIGRQPGSEEAA